MDYRTVASISTPFVLLYLHHRSHYFNGYILAGAEKPLESSLCSYNFNIAYVVKFFGPSGSLAVENFRLTGYAHKMGWRGKGWETAGRGLRRRGLGELGRGDDTGRC